MFYIGCNHLGEVKDTPSRIIQLLKTVDLVIIEHEEVFLSDLKELNIDIPNYVTFNRSAEFFDQIISMLKDEKNVLLLNEMGYPSTADPGSDLIRVVHENDLTVDVIAGPSIGPMAMAASGYSSTMYTVAEFFQKSEYEIKDTLAKLNVKDNIIVALHHKENIIDVLKCAKESIPDKFVSLLINLGWTKNQKIIRGYIDDVIKILEEGTIESIYGPQSIRPIATLVFS
jgi:16S rRNA (cytidine1402-2'-O)-methyltransferase